MSHLKAKFSLGLLATASAALACQALQMAPAKVRACIAARGELSLQETLVNTNTNEVGTRACHYNITIMNYAPYPITPVVYSYHEDGYQKLKEGKWEVLRTLNPGESYVFPSEYTTFQDPDASGPLVGTIKRYIGIIDRAECRQYWTDKASLDKYAFYYSASSCKP